MPLTIWTLILFVFGGAIVVAGEVSSEAVSLGKGDHRLVYDTEHGFRLVRMSDDALPSSARPVVQPCSMPLLEHSERVLDIALSRWGSTSFVGTVHSRNDDGDTFTFLTIIHPESSGDTVTAHAVEAFRCESGYRILALSGDRRGEEITLLVGKRSAEERGNVVSSGRIVYHGCPNPSPVGAKVGRFTTQYEPESLIQKEVPPVENEKPRP